MTILHNPTGPDPTCRRRRNADLLLWAGILLASACILILASVPPVSRDALNHHLVVPGMYLQHGGVYEIPYMFFSYYPMNLNLLYLAPLYLDHDIAAKYIHFLFSLLTAGLIYHYLKQVLNPAWGLLGALFFMTIPVIVKLSVTVYVDLGLIFFSWAALYLLLKWHDSCFSPRFLILSGVACGLALGTKYNGLLLLPIMGAAIPLLYASNKNRGIPREAIGLRYRHSFSGLVWAAAFLMTALILFSPWMIRNLIWQQNPVYPLYNGFFNPPAPDPSAAAPAGIESEKPPPQNAFWMRRHVYEESFAKTLLIPVRAFFQGRDDDPRHFDGRLNPFLLLLPLAAFIRVRKPFLGAFKTHRTVLALFALLYMLFVFFQADFRIRYMAPAIPPLIILSVFGLKNLADMAAGRSGLVKKAGPVMVVFLVMSALLYNGHYIYVQFRHIQPFTYLSGAVDRDTYISHFRREHPVMLYANRVLPEDARVLCLSIGDRTYYLDRKAHLAADFYRKPPAGFTEADLLEKLIRHGTTHIVIDRAVLFDWLRTLPRSDQEIFLKVFETHTRLLYEENEVLLLALEVQ